MAKSPKKKPTAAKKTPKVREDIATTAFRVMMEATGQAPKTPDPDAGKDPAAVSLGRRGGLKGGKARAKKMTAAQRKASAKKAAEARWGKAAHSG
jgi:hypothetical protein